ncbi:MAG TPA: chemotaxis protein CheB [Thermodesulfovibrionales bacterium]|nr:chemotaxis protein CheB [Thermodesulfovibrionales bacterium]
MAARRKKKETKERKDSVKKRAASSDNTLHRKRKTVLSVPEKNQPVRSEREDFYIVGIGASAGGLDAFERFFTNMSADSGMAFVLIPHLSPEHKSIMSDLLKRYTKMEVSQAEDGVEVKRDCVYIIPPNKDMALMGRKIQLLEPVERKGLRHPIDFFFRSLAEDCGEKAICIVLSGTGTEGTLGLRAVKEKGGLALVQEVKSAQYAGMPASALATGLADYVLPPEKMPEELLRYVKHVRAMPLKPAVMPDGKTLEPLQKIFVLIRAHTGHDLSMYKQNTIIRRIEKRMAILQIKNLTDYVSYLRRASHEIDVLFKELLIRVTSFFRDSEAFDALKEKGLPLLFKGRPCDQPVRIWIPGCSTGEEAYSVAIAVHEYMHAVNNICRVQIFATDLDSEAIGVARAGVYPDSITVDVSPERLERFFTPKGVAYKVKDEIREMIVFAAQNIAKDPPFTKLDVIICRNVLIYLGTDLQKKLIPIFHYSLKPEGILFLGSSETTGDFSDLFAAIDKRWKIFKTRMHESAAVWSLDLRRPSAIPEGTAGREALPAIKRNGVIEIGEITEKILLDHYSPPCVIVNDKGDVLYFHGKTGKYLEPASGKARLNIIEMAREGLTLELRTALRRAAARKKDIAIEGVQVKADGGYLTVNLEVKYISKPDSALGLLMVVFREPSSPKGRKIEKLRAYIPGKSDQRLADMDQELRATKEHLQATIEELESANEELRSSNEEMQSSNEELQSTNEELETSKEELQSVNEELVTVNAELQNKIEELSQVNNDMNNLLASTQVATIFLNAGLRIKRFTPAMTNVFNLIYADIGRPISDIVSKLDYPELLTDAGEVLRTLMVKEKEVRDHKGLWYLTRVLPYRTTENIIDGVVITFTDVTKQKKTQEALQDAMNYAEGIVETVREPLVILDAAFKVITANRSFYQAFTVSREETEGRLIFELGNRQWDIPALRELLEKVLPQNAQFENFEVEHIFPATGHKKLLLNARRIYQADKQTEMILLAIEDISGR